MMHLRMILWSSLAVLALHQSSAGQFAVDGTLVGDESEYAAALSIQNTNTQYGNATNGDPRFANGGSEIDQVFGKVQGGRLHVLVAGNLESNFNKLEVFIDSVPGGMNQLNGANLPPGVDPYCCGAVGSPAALQRMSGFRFDAGFEADRYLTFSNGVHPIGSPTINRWTLTAYYADLASGAGGKKSEVGFQYNPYGVEPGLAQGEPIDQLNNGCSGPADTNCSPPEHEFAEPIDTVNDPSNNRGHRDLVNDIGLLMAIDNSNTAGVVSGAGATAGNPQTVVKGIEFSLPLAELGNPTGDIKLTAFINNGSHSFVSNQFSGVGILQGNLGGNLAAINLATIAGNQYVTVPNQGPAGDYNRNNVVDAADYIVYRNSFGQSAAGLAADGDNSGTIDFGDYNVWRAHFGNTTNSGSGFGANTAVPEPATVALVALTLLLAILCRVRRGVVVNCR